MLRATFCIIITVSQIKGFTLCCKLELHVLRQKKIWLNPGSNLTIIRGTGSSMVDSQREWLEASHIQQALVE